MENQTPVLEEQPLPNVAPVVSLVEVKFREILNFDTNIADLIHYALWQRGIPEGSAQAKHIAASLNVNLLWSRVYQAMSQVHTEEELQTYINVISKVQSSLTTAFEILGGEVHELVSTLHKNLGDGT